MNIEVAILDENFIILGQIDEYESLIWTDRYYDAGDFEIYARASTELLLLIQNGRYAKIADSNKVMFLEDVSIETEADQGDYITITGRSLESMLSRAIALNKITVNNGSFQEFMQRLLNENMIAPSDSNRAFSNLEFQVSTDPIVTALLIDLQVQYEEIFEILKTLSELHQTGFEIVLTPNGKFIFNLYAGEDRSRNQTANPYVIFAPQNENIASSRYFESSKELKHVAIVIAEYQYETSSIDPETGEEVTEQMTKSIQETVGSGEGLNRRELYVDARDISSTTEDDRQLSEAQFRQLVIERGEESLKEHSTTKTFDGEIDASKQPKYGVDFFMGDVVEIANAYGMSATARVIELVRTLDSSGFKEVPGFIML